MNFQSFRQIPNGNEGHTEATVTSRLRQVFTDAPLSLEVKPNMCVRHAEGENWGFKQEESSSFVVLVFQRKVDQRNDPVVRKWQPWQKLVTI